MPIVAIWRPIDEAGRRNVPLFVDSDADCYVQAIREVEEWCRANGLLRARENYLRTLRTANGLVRRGICYEPSAELAQRQEEWAEMSRRLEAIPETLPDDDTDEEA